MGTQVIAAESEPATPSAGNVIHWFDNQGLIPCWKNANGDIIARSENGSIAAQGAGFASDTYVTDSNILIPSFGMKPRSWMRWMISLSKTAAGVATPIAQIRIGANGSTADTSRLTLTGPAQTAVADIATLWIMLTTRSQGAAGVIQGTMWFNHRGTAASSTGGTGFANDQSGHVEATSAGFDNQGITIGGLKLGLSLNGGASASWTITQVRTEAKW